MSENIHRIQLALEIKKKLGGRRSVSTDCIEAILVKKLLFYVPSFPAATSLIEEWDKVSGVNVIITTSLLEFKKKGYWIQNVSTIYDLMAGKPACKTLVLTVNQVKQHKELYEKHEIWSKEFTCIFDECIDEIGLTSPITNRYFASHSIFTNATFTFGITRNPIILNNFYNTHNRYMDIYVHRTYLNKYFYKSMIDTSQQVYYDSSTVDEDFLSFIRTQVPKNVFNVVEHLVNAGLFCSSFFEDYVLLPQTFLSSKIAALLSTLEKTAGYLTLLYINNPLERYIVHKLLLHLSLSTISQQEQPISFEEIQLMVEKDITNAKIDHYGDKCYEKTTSVITNRVLKATGTKINVRIIHHIRDKHTLELFNIIIFNYVPYLSKDYRIFILPLAMKNKLNMQMRTEMLLLEKIQCEDLNSGQTNPSRSKCSTNNNTSPNACNEDETELSNTCQTQNEGQQKIDVNQSYTNKKEETYIPSSTENYSFKPDTLFKSFKFTLLAGDFHEVEEKLKKKSHIISVSLENNKIIVFSRTSIGRLATCFNIQVAIKEPVLIPRFPPAKHATFLICEHFELSTLTSFKSMINSKKYNGHCYLMVTDRKITIFFFKKKNNLRIEFTGEGLEDFIVFTLERLKGKSRVTKPGEDEVNMYGQPATPPYDIFKEVLYLSFCLKTKPRVFSCDDSPGLYTMLSDTLPVSQKCQFFLSVEWTRLTQSEFKDFDERFDIRVAISCSQSLPTHIYNNFVDSITLQLKQISPSIPDRVEYVTHMVRNYYIDTVNRAFSSYPVQLVASNMSIDIKPFLSLSMIVKYFEDSDFTSLYSVACLVSRKGRFLLSKVDTNTLEYISQQLLTTYCPCLDKTITTRFEHIDFNIAYSARAPLVSTPLRSLIRSVILTPMNMTFEYEMLLESNRVLRHFDPDKFCKFLIRDENGKDKFSTDVSNNTDHVYEHFRKFLLNGFTIGHRKYFFLVMTTSQLKVHGSWFVTPYEKDNEVIGADSIKRWIGSFQSIKNIGKYAARIGLALSSTVYARDVDEFVEIEDTVRNGYLFTDGIGLCSRKLAIQICKDLKLESIPSAFQIRFAGYKGVIAVHPWLEDIYSCQDNLFVEELVTKVKEKTKGLITEIDSLDDEATYKLKKLKSVGFQMPDFILRKSMNKFESKNRGLEIVGIPKSCDFYLNRQIIMMLEGLGVSPQVFIDYQNKYIYNLLVLINADYSSFVKTYSCFSEHASSGIQFYRKLQAPVLSRIFEELNTKANILIEQGRGAMGVVDELGILEEDQVFCMLKKRSNENLDGLIDYGSYVVPNCYCIVAKNPVMHPGDIRLVKCVDCPQLHYLKDLIVFSKKGTRPIFNQCSGSDLDGDIFYVSWARGLIPQATFKPYNYTDSNALTKERVLFSDIVNFFIRSMKYYQLGTIAHSYMAIADRYTVFDERALKLSQIFNKSIDYIKTGNLVVIPEDLVPVKYPDFMERAPSYRSTRALGQLYRRSLFDLSGLKHCECRSCVLKGIQEQCRYKEFLLMGAGVATRDIQYNGPIDQEYSSIFNKYKQELLQLMNRFQQPNEEDLFCQNADSEVRCELRKLVESFKQQLTEKQSAKMAAVSSCSPFSSLALLCPDAYKLKDCLKKSIIKEGTSRFFFNSKIHLQNNSCPEIVQYYNNMSVDETVEQAKTPTTDRMTLKSFQQEKMPLLSMENVHLFYENKVCYKEVTVECNKAIINKFINSLDYTRKELFKEFFNLILIAGIYKITELDMLFNYFISLNALMNNSTITELLRVAIPLSNDAIFKILCLLSLDLSLEKKSILLREKSPRVLSESFQQVKICKRTKFIISGMLDENDDFLFLRRDDRFIPILRNQGECSVDYYKDSLRDFLVNLLFSQENHVFLKKLSAIDIEAVSNTYPKCTPLTTKDDYNPKINISPEQKDCESSTHIHNNVYEELELLIKKTNSNSQEDTRTTENVAQSLNTVNNREHCSNNTERDVININNSPVNNENDRAVFELFLIPGEFFFTKVPASQVNERISVKYLEVVLSAKDAIKNFEHSFLNVHSVLDPSKRVEFIKTLKPIKKTGVKELLSFIYNGVRYDIEYLNDCLQRITKDKLILGKAYILNNSVRNDLKVELYRKELIYGNNLNILADFELFMVDKLFEVSEKSYTIFGDRLDLKSIAKMKLERQVIFHTEDGFHMVQSMLYSDLQNSTLTLKSDKFNCYVYREFTLETLENFNFDRIYGRLWKMYNQILK